MRGSGMNWEIGIDISTLPCINRWLVGCCLEKAMETHSSTLAWKIPWMEGPGRLQSMGSLGVGHD